MGVGVTTGFSSLCMDKSWRRQKLAETIQVAVRPTIKESRTATRLQRFGLWVGWCQLASRARRAAGGLGHCIVDVPVQAPLASLTQSTPNKELLPSFTKKKANGHSQTQQSLSGTLQVFSTNTCVVLVVAVTHNDGGSVREKKLRRVTPF
jgi:hypothetical protein